MTPGEALAVVAAGLGAGVLTSTVGVASLLSFPVLLALGLPPVVASATNTVGLTPGALSGCWGYRRELAEKPRVAATVAVTCALGGVAGALLLLYLPPGVFVVVVPWLILASCVLVAAQPAITASLRTRSGEVVSDAPSDGLAPLTAAFATLTGVYGGYFGAASGVMMAAVLSLGTRLEFRLVNVLKTLAVLSANVVASVVFLFIADIDGLVVLLLAAGSLVGGYLGSRIGRRLPAGLLRALIVVAGVVAAIVLWTR